MKALLLKDFFTLKKQLNWIVFIILFFIVFSFFTGDGMLLLTLAFVFGTVQVSSLFTYDEMSRFDQFVNTLPVKKENVILSKYVLTVLLTIGINIIIIPVVAFHNMNNPKDLPIDLVSIICFFMSVTIFLSSITLPFYVKFGSHKGRIVMFAVVFIPIFLMGFIAKSIENVMTNFSSFETINTIAYFSPIVSCLLLVVSYFISVNIYKNKEF